MIKQKTEKEGINMKTVREFKKNSRGNVRGNERERHRGEKEEYRDSGRERE